MKYKNIFVPGGNGFLGKAVVEKLQTESVDVTSLSLRDGYDFRDFSQTNELFKEQKFDAVINCAAFVGGIQYGYERPGELFFNNVLMSTYLMEAARLNDVKRFVNPISNCSYPADLSTFSENEWWCGEFHDSVMAYGFVRKASWVQSWAYKKQYGFDTINLILPNMYGPRDHFNEKRSHALGALVKKIVDAKKKKLPEVIVWGTGSPIREWLYVEDGAEALIRTLELPKDFAVDPINIGIGKGISIRELAELIKKIVGYQGSIVLDASKPDGALCKIMNVKRMKSVLAWQPSTSLEEGIRITVEWYEENNMKDSMGK